MNLSLHRDRIGSDLVNQGWTVLDDFFDPVLIQQLTRECRLQQQRGLLRAAGVGRADQQVVDKSLRGDQTRWLETGMAPSIDQFLSHIDALRQFFNKTLFLGLQDAENHFALYPPGAFYQKHLDRFQRSDSRVISSVLYLNPDWQPAHGGELRLHLDKRHVDIEPIANRLVLFISAQIAHEVLPTTVDRLSLTGWLRRNAQPV